MSGQPENYPDILTRLFWSSVVVGFLCTLTLGLVAPQCAAFLTSLKIDVEIGPVKGMKLLYLLIPLAVAVLSHMFKLHDRISDLFGLRKTLDTKHILFPLAEKTRGPLDATQEKLIALHRREAMLRVFYPCVTLPNAKIDNQLVRSALDNIGWFWVLVEALFLLAVSAGITRTLSPPVGTGWFVIAWLVVFLLAIRKWLDCQKTAAAEVEAIASDKALATHAKDYFDSLW